MVDSVSFVVNSEPVSQAVEYIIKENSVFDIICSIATVAIAVANIFLVAYIFKQEAINSKDENNKARKWDFLINVIIQPNLYHLYGFFNKVESETSKLLEELDLSSKQLVNSNIIDLASSFRKDFLILLSVVDKNLYDSSLKIIDNMIDGLTVSIFDNGINLTHQPKFEAEISTKVLHCKQSLLSNIYCATDLKNNASNM